MLNTRSLTAQRVRLKVDLINMIIKILKSTRKLLQGDMLRTRRIIMETQPKLIPQTLQIPVLTSLILQKMIAVVVVLDGLCSGFCLSYFS